ncbi:MAG: potassium transporter TrkA, partial [Verrucomicrobia bacterium]|nr:potassium transporter TrkA [Verrucomicrobiota bacterium]
MISILTLLVVVMFSLLITRVVTRALVLTGLSSEAARFQARSAFSGVGFTTSESEAIVNHPVRRRIILLAMLWGNIGIATVVATAIMSYISASHADHWWLHVILLLSGLALLWYLASSRRVERWMNRAISAGLRRWTQLD